MTDDRMALLQLAEKHGDGDFLRELGQWTLQRLMELEAQALGGAEPYRPRVNGGTSDSADSLNLESIRIEHKCAVEWLSVLWALPRLPGVYATGRYGHAIESVHLFPSCCRNTDVQASS